MIMLRKTFVTRVCTQNLVNKRAKLVMINILKSISWFHSTLNWAQNLVCIIFWNLLSGVTVEM